MLGDLKALRCVCVCLSVSVCLCVRGLFRQPLRTEAAEIPRGEQPQPPPLRRGCLEPGETWDPPVVPNTSPTLLQAELIRAPITWKCLESRLPGKGRPPVTTSIAEITTGGCFSSQWLPQTLGEGRGKAL